MSSKKNQDTTADVTMWKAFSRSDETRAILSAHDNSPWYIGQKRSVVENDYQRVSLCHHGFHASKRLVDAYSYISGDVIGQVVMSGTQIDDDDKSVSAEMTLVKAWIVPQDVSERANNLLTQDDWYATLFSDMSDFSFETAEQYANDHDMPVSSVIASWLMYSIVNQIRNNTTGTHEQEDRFIETLVKGFNELVMVEPFTDTTEARKKRYDELEEEITKLSEQRDDAYQSYLSLRNNISSLIAERDTVVIENLPIELCVTREKVDA